MLRKFLATPILLAFISLSVFADSGKVEAIGAFADAAASDSLKKAVEEKGYRVTLPDGAVVCGIGPFGAAKAATAASIRPETMRVIID